MDTTRVKNTELRLRPRFVPAKSQFILDKIAEEEELTVGESELSAWLMQQAPRYDMAPDAFAQALVEAGQVPMAMADIRRAKALAKVPGERQGC